MRNSWVAGNLWPCVAMCGGSIAEDLFGFCTLKSLEDFCELIFCEILSEILEIWDGRLQTLLDLLPFWSTLAVAILIVFDIGKAASVSVVMLALSFIQVVDLVQFFLTFESQNLTLNIICLVAVFKGLPAHLFLFCLLPKKFSI